MITAIEIARATLPDERRQQPRVRVDGRIAVRPQDGGRPVAARLFDVSIGGVQLRCSRAEALEFITSPGGSEADRLRGEWRMELPDCCLEIAASGRRRYVHKAGEDELAIGFEFTELDEGSRRRLEDWLVRHLEPA
jgi:c-di-GMP-binding flagellar brake protein YcgR